MRVNLFPMMLVLYLILQVFTMEKDTPAQRAYSWIKPCEPKHFDDDESFEIPVSTRLANFRCLQNYAWLDPIHTCQIKVQCMKNQVVSMFPQCREAPISCHGKLESVTDGEIIFKINENLIDITSVKGLPPDYGDVCRFEGLEIKKCEHSEDKALDYYFLIDQDQKTVIRRTVNLVEWENAQDIHNYKCRHDKDDTECYLDNCEQGLCDGDAYYRENFKGGSRLGDCHCVYDKNMTQFKVKYGKDLYSPAMIVRTKVIVQIPYYGPKSYTLDCDDCDARCTDVGLTVHTGLLKAAMFRVCGNPTCVSGIPEGEEFKIELPIEMLLHGGERHIEIWEKNSAKVHRVEIACSPIQECKTVNCFLCSRYWTTVNCYGPVHWLVVGLMTSLGIITLGKVAKGIERLMVIFMILVTPLKYLGRVILWLPGMRRATMQLEKKRDQEISEGIKSKSITKKDLMRASLISPVILCTLLLCMPATACSATANMQSHMKTCYIDDGIEVCSITGQLRLSVSPVGQFSCFRLFDANDKPLGGFNIKTEWIQLACMKNHLYHVPQAVPSCQSYKRCRGAGDCTDSNCETVSSSYKAESWSQTMMDHYGTTTCGRISGCAGNGCGLCADACLWVRSYLENPTGKTYEVFECLEWTYAIRIEVTRGEALSLKQESLILTADSPQTVMDATITLVSVSIPPQPVLGKCIMVSDDGIAALVECSRQTELVPGKIGEINCPDKEAAVKINSRCSAVKDFNTVTFQSDKSTCVSKLTNPEKVMAEDTLPKQIGGIMITYANGTVTAEARHNAILELQLDLQGAHFAANTDHSLCDFKFMNITGCYSCSSGATIFFSAKANRGAATAHLDCKDDQGVFKVQSSYQVIQTNRVIKDVFHLDDAIVNLDCTVDCPAGKTHMRIEGSLVKAGWKDVTDERRVVGIDTGTKDSGIHWDDILSANWFNSWWKKVLVIAGLIVLVIVLILIIKFLIGMCRVVTPTR